MALFESYERRIDQINAALAKYDIKSIEEAKAICDEKGINVYDIVKSTQPICFENACWAYTVGAAMAIKNGDTKAEDAAKTIGVGLQSFCIPGSVADDRKVGLGHGNLGAMLLNENTQCFAFLAGHESFAAAEGAIKIAEKANKVRKNPLRVILNGLGKDAAKIISRINGFTYVETQFDYFTGEVKEVSRTAYSDGPRAKVNCYGADDVREGVAIMHKEGVDVSITGNLHLHGNGIICLYIIGTDAGSHCEIAYRTGERGRFTRRQRLDVDRNRGRCQFFLYVYIRRRTEEIIEYTASLSGRSGHTQNNIQFPGRDRNLP